MIDPPEAAVSWLLRMAEAPLDEAELVEFEAWLEADPLHAQHFRVADRVWREVGVKVSTPEMVVLRTKALDDLQGAARLGRVRTLWRSPSVVALTTICVLAFAVVGWRTMTPQIYRTGIGERRVVALSDGSKVSLDSDTQVQVRFADGQRRLVLDRGRARFAVAHDPLKPFSVLADGKLVVALGTEFSVERLQREVRVILYKGKVSVLTKDAPFDRAEPVPIGQGHRPAEQVLKPGGELVLANVAAVVQLAPSDLQRSLAWEGGKLIFAEEPLSQAVERVNRYVDRPLTVGDPAAAKMVISGVFNAGDAEAFIDGVTGVLPLSARRELDRVVLSSSMISVR